MSRMHVVTDHKYAPIFKAWLEEKLECQLKDDVRFITNVLLHEGGEAEILFCAALGEWTEHSCEVFAASDGSKREKLSREYMFTFFDYAFNHAGKNCIYSHIKRENVKSRQLQRGVGLIECGQVNGFYGPDRDAIIYSITKQQWLNGKWGSLNSKGEQKDG